METLKVISFTKENPMKYSSALKILIPLIGLLGAVCRWHGSLLPNPGEPYPFTSHRGETVMINGRGLYYYDTVSSAAQQQGNDVVTLFIALPLLVVSSWMTFRDSLRGRLLLTGTIGFFLYTYLSMCMLTAFNALFLVYVAIFGLSLYAFILCMMAFDLEDSAPPLLRPPAARLDRGTVVRHRRFFDAHLADAGLVAADAGHAPLLDNGITMVIQAMDLKFGRPIGSSFRHLASSPQRLGLSL
ncbi:MAG: hypothetical protein MZV63_07140 [Marinilabiliales bacterium]|nr:hypothetical protein [Marinilabiliales bacterium]